MHVIYPVVAITYGLSAAFRRIWWCFDAVEFFALYAAFTGLKAAQASLDRRLGTDRMLVCRQVTPGV
jgi:hypothetical protein